MPQELAEDFALLNSTTTQLLHMLKGYLAAKLSGGLGQCLHSCKTHLDSQVRFVTKVAFLRFHRQNQAAVAPFNCCFAECLTACLHVCRLGDRTLTVSYAEPKQSEMNQDQVKSVYVGGLAPGSKHEDLKTFFEGLDLGKVCFESSVLRMKTAEIVSCSNACNKPG